MMAGFTDWVGLYKAKLSYTRRIVWYAQHVGLRLTSLGPCATVQYVHFPSRSCHVSYLVNELS